MKMMNIKGLKMDNVISWRFQHDRCLDMIGQNQLNLMLLLAK